jgi:glycosyltransferase involved in cell wall biosynthesis
MPHPLSVYIIARNEADRIGRAIASARILSDDVVVIDDGHSTDDTASVAAAAGARVILNPWSGYGPQKYFAEDQCRNDWVLCLDADEVITPALAAEITALLVTNPPHDFYRLKLVDVYPGATRPRRWVKPINVIRLFRRSRGRTSTSPVHDRVVLPDGATVGQLAAPAWHYSIRSLDHLIKKYDKYTSLQAETMGQKSYTLLTIRLLTEYPMAFMQYFLFDRHLTGGLYGYGIARVLANARFQRILKMWERAHQTRCQKNSEKP